VLIATLGARPRERDSAIGVSGSQLLILVVIGLVAVAVMGTWYRPLLFASVDPEAAEARGVPVRVAGPLLRDRRHWAGRL